MEKLSHNFNVHDGRDVHAHGVPDVHGGRGVHGVLGVLNVHDEELVREEGCEV